MGKRPPPVCKPMTPTWLAQDSIALRITKTSHERLAILSERLNMPKGRIVDALIRSIDPSELDDRVHHVVGEDARALMAWRRS